MSESQVTESPFSKIAHIGVVVRNMDEAIERLSSAGIGPFEIETAQSKLGTVLFRDKPLHAKVKVCHVKMGDWIIELLQPVEGTGSHMEYLNSKGEGIQHIGFRVDDIDKEVAKLTEQGFSVQTRGNWEGGGSAYVYMDLGVGGLVMEIMKKKKDI